MEVRIERAAPEDASDLIEIQNLGFLEDFSKYGECPSYEEPLENMVDMITNAIVYKISVNGKMAGDIIVRKKDEGWYYLRTISVIPEYQNLGIGTRAMGFIEEENPGGAYWLLTTPAGTERNRHFYEKLGYRKIAEHRRSERLTLIEYKKDLEGHGAIDVRNKIC